MPNKAH